jgi:hypothetical protein
MRHAQGMTFQESMDSTSPPAIKQPPLGAAQRFGAGLTEAEVRRFQAILREECGFDVGLPEAWGRAIELLSLVELLLQWRGILDGPSDASTEFALPRS